MVKQGGGHKGCVAGSDGRYFLCFGQGWFGDEWLGCCAFHCMMWMEGRSKGREGTGVETEARGDENGGDGRGTNGGWRSNERREAGAG